MPHCYNRRGVFRGPKRCKARCVPVCPSLYLKHLAVWIAVQLLVQEWYFRHSFGLVFNDFEGP